MQTRLHAQTPRALRSHVSSLSHVPNVRASLTVGSAKVRNSEAASSPAAASPAPAVSPDGNGTHATVTKHKASKSVAPVQPQSLTIATSQPPSASHHVPNLGVHIANRLVEVGCTTVFGVPGDFNLLLLDQLIKHPQLNAVWCCNELNAGYAADGYARKRGIGCLVVTFTVGGLSALNAVAGAYSEDLPLIVISGTPNSNDYSSNRILHHTIGLPDFNQQLRAMKEFTCCQVTITHIEDAARLIDTAISAAIKYRKPAYIEVSCNLPAVVHPSFTRLPVPYNLPVPHNNKASMDAAVDAVVKALASAVKPVLLAGPQLRKGGARTAFMKLVEASKFPMAILPDAKGLIDETHPQFMGLYWGCASWPCVCEVVESSDCVITVGVVWTDYTTCGYSLLLSMDKIIQVAGERVVIKSGTTFGCVDAEYFMNALAEKVQPNSMAMDNFKRMYVPPGVPPRQLPGEGIITTVLYKHIQDMLTPDMAVIAETGDAWFHTQTLRLPKGTEYQIQMRYGSIGWSVGCVLGYSAAAKGTVRHIDGAQRPKDGWEAVASRRLAAAKAEYGASTVDMDAGMGQGLMASCLDGDSCATPKRVLAFIGDGSFQMSAQEVSTMLRYGLNPIIILVNNRGYTIEVEIHDGPYNEVNNWNYTGFVEALNNGQGKLWTAKVNTEEELEAALATAQKRTQDLCFIEVTTHREDCSKALLEWGSRVAAANGRPHMNH